MRCIFCHQNSHHSKSVEHIIPESFGNKRHVVPAGIVCDKCNNYFSRKVEGPLLSHRSFRNLRAWYQVPTKKGKMPKLNGVIGGTNVEVGLRVAKDGGIEVSPEKEKERHILDAYMKDGMLGAPLMFIRDIDPPKDLMSRLLGKMALEAFALRTLDQLDRYIEDDPFGRLREWARYGRSDIEWPYHQRTIYPEDTLMKHPETYEWVQAGFSHDLFVTKRRETYVCFCIHGHEFVMNVVGPSIKGYEEWLQDNGNISPVVERIGLRLETVAEAGQTVTRLNESGKWRSGQQFDLSQNPFQNT